MNKYIHAEIFKKKTKNPKNYYSTLKQNRCAK